MFKSIELGDQKVSYLLKLSRRARRLRLAVHPDGNFIVTAPGNLSLAAIERFIVKQSRWVLGKMAYFQSLPRPLLSRGARKDFLEQKDLARELVRRRIEHFNKDKTFSFNKISIRNQKTRWGSCSRNGNLNFNYKLFSLPEKLADYIIVHELCHLKEFNHSAKFWSLVESFLPDYAESRKALKKGYTVF
jgi:predicted metal-dependent hydrolase